MENNYDILLRNMREMREAMVAMRNTINEHVPMPSEEADLLTGPETSVFCAAVAEAVVAHVDKTAQIVAYARVIAETKVGEVEHYQAVHQLRCLLDGKPMLKSVEAIAAAFGVTSGVVTGRFVAKNPPGAPPISQTIPKEKPYRQRVSDAAKDILQGDEHGSLSIVYDACEKKVRAHKFVDALRELAKL